CTDADVPILKLLSSPCEDGQHGYACSDRWDLLDSFLPTPSKWLSEFRASQSAVVNCQRAFFDAMADKMTRAHWEQEPPPCRSLTSPPRFIPIPSPSTVQEWDAQPFRISAAPPRTIGKMLHQALL
ncbi:MAG: hypothetical protein SGPRY_007916, partial [Prymnesium sp.]